MNNAPHPAKNNDAHGGRMPPQAVEIEESVLGAMLIEQGAAEQAFSMLSDWHFYKTAHRHIYNSLWDLYEEDKSLDLLSLENHLKDRGLLDSCGGSTYISDLTRSVSSSANIQYHAQILVEKGLKRQVILDSNEVIKDAYDLQSDAYDVLEKAESRIFELSTKNIKKDIRHAEEGIHGRLDFFGKLRENPGAITGVPTGLDVDQLTNGFKKGDLVIIAGRPSMGKTAFALTAARNAATTKNGEDGKPYGVAIFSLEMSESSLIDRFLTMEARIDAQKAREGRISDKEYERMIDAGTMLAQSSIFIDDTPGLNILELRTKCRKLMRKEDIGMILIDYLQLMGSTNDKASNREQEVAYISRALKGLAKELDVPVIALAQLSRAVEQRGGDKRPQLSDLRESGQIEQDADVIIFLYRPEYYGITTTAEGHDTTGIAEIIVGKQRNGPVGTKKANFIKKYARFERLANSSMQSMEPQAPVPKHWQDDDDDDFEIDEDLPF